ncbi:MAG: DUF2155 domain-containing protein [Burkholderiales bacterium]|nr:DUF2155 domain-containing protein [Burkholderiales bacterium]
MTTARALTGVALLAVAASLAGGGAWALQNAPQQPPPAQLPPAAPAAPSAPVAPSTATPAPVPVQIAPTPAPTPQPETPKPADAPSAKPEEPAKRARGSVAIIQALDKVTTETMRFEAPVGQPIRYKTLVFTVRACETTTPDEDAPDQVAYVTVDTQPKALPGRIAPPGRQIYKGWMYANSPGLNPLEHPVYDAWLIACKTSAPEAPAASR